MLTLEEIRHQFYTTRYEIGVLMYSKPKKTKKGGKGGKKGGKYGKK